MANKEMPIKTNENGEATRIRQLTPKEKLRVETFGSYESPASLKLAQNYVKTLRGKVLKVRRRTFGRVFGNLIRKRSGEVMDGTALKKYADNSYEHVAMFGVVGGVEFDVRKQLLLEALRVVKPGGTVAVAEFKKYEESEAPTGELGTRVIIKKDKEGKSILKDGKPFVLFFAKYFTEDELINLFEDTGFTKVQTQGEPIGPVGSGKGIVEARRQYTVWGTKPLTQ